MHRTGTRREHRLLKTRWNVQARWRDEAFRKKTRKNLSSSSRKNANINISLINEMKLDDFVVEQACDPHGCVDLFAFILYFGKYI